MSVTASFLFPKRQTCLPIHATCVRQPRQACMITCDVTQWICFFSLARHLATHIIYLSEIKNSIKINCYISKYLLVAPVWITLHWYDLMLIKLRGSQKVFNLYPKRCSLISSCSDSWLPHKIYFPTKSCLVYTLQSLGPIRGLYKVYQVT